MKNLNLRISILFSLVVSLVGCKKADPPVADFSYTINEMTVTFNDKSSGEIDTYLWNFGDGNTSTSISPVHTYSSEGEYHVTLEVTNEGGVHMKGRTLFIEDDPSGNNNGGLVLTDMDGAMYAINSSTETNGMTVKISSALALFNDGSGNLVYAGSVEANTEALDFLGNNTYHMIQNPAADFLFINRSIWSVEGQNGIPEIVEYMAQGFPNVDGLHTSTTIPIDVDYYMETYATNADSITFVLYDAQGNSTDFKTIDGNYSMQLFTPSDMSNLQKGPGAMAQITAYKLFPEIINGKKMYFVNQHTYTTMVTLQ